MGGCEQGTGRRLLVGAGPGARCARRQGAAWAEGGRCGRAGAGAAGGQHGRPCGVLGGGPRPVWIPDGGRCGSRTVAGVGGGGWLVWAAEGGRCGRRTVAGVGGGRWRGRVVAGVAGGGWVAGIWV